MPRGCTGLLDQNIKTFSSFFEVISKPFIFDSLLFLLLFFLSTFPSSSQEPRFGLLTNNLKAARTRLARQSLDNDDEVAATLRTQQALTQARLALLCIARRRRDASSRPVLSLASVQSSWSSHWPLLFFRFFQRERKRINKWAYRGGRGGFNHGSWVQNKPFVPFPDINLPDGKGILSDLDQKINKDLEEETVIKETLNWLMKSEYNQMMKKMRMMKGIMKRSKRRRRRRRMKVMIMMRSIF